MEMNNKQHVQVPNLTENDSEIQPTDLLIYACIRRHMNLETKKAFPSLDKIKDESGASVPTVRKSIKILENYNYFTVIKERGISGKLQNVYLINTNKCEHFERFSFEFLDKKDITFRQKAYILATQQFMEKENTLGKISDTNKVLSEKIHMPESTISKCNRELTNSGYLVTIKNSIQRDLETGCHTDIKVFDLNKLGQAMVCALVNHEDRITNNEENIQDLKSENEQLRKDIEMLKRVVFKEKESQTFTM